MQGPRLDELQRASDTLAERARKIPGLVDVDTSLRTGKPEVSVRLDRPEGRRSRRAGGGRGRGAAAAGRRRSGDDLQRGRRAVPGAPARRRAEPRLRGRHRAAHGASARLGSVPLENIASFAHGEAPADIRRLEPAAPGDRVRQHAAGHVADRGTDADSEAAAQLGLGSEYRMGYPAGRASSNRTAQRLPAGARAVAHLHVPRAGGAVRVVAAPGDDPAVAAAHAAVRAASRSSSSASRSTSSRRSACWCCSAW